MPETIIVNVRHTREFDLYIGRSMTNSGLYNAGWGNPWRTPRDGTAAEVLARYEAWVRGQPRLMARLPELRSKRLACWCAPPEGLTTWRGRLVCHGQVLLKLLAELDGGHVSLPQEATR